MTDIERESFDFTLGSIKARLDSNDRVHEEIKTMIQGIGLKLDTQLGILGQEAKVASSEFRQVAINTQRLALLEEHQASMSSTLVKLKTEASLTGGLIGTIMGALFSTTVWFLRHLHI